MTPTPLLDWTPPAPRGSTFDPQRDGRRLSDQARRVFDLMKDGAFRSLADISYVTGDPEASISARLRDLRAAGYTVNRRYIQRGLWHYSVTRT